MDASAWWPIVLPGCAAPAASPIQVTYSEFVLSTRCLAEDQHGLHSILLPSPLPLPGLFQTARNFENPSQLPVEKWPMVSSVFRRGPVWSTEISSKSRAAGAGRSADVIDFNRNRVFGNSDGFWGTLDLSTCEVHRVRLSCEATSTSHRDADPRGCPGRACPCRAPFHSKSTWHQRTWWDCEKHRSNDIFVGRTLGAAPPVMAHSPIDHPD